MASEKELILVSEAEAERPGNKFGAHPRHPGLGLRGLGTAKSGQVPTSTDKSRQTPKDLEKEGTMADRAASLDIYEQLTDRVCKSRGAWALLRMEIRCKTQVLILNN